MKLPYKDKRPKDESALFVAKNANLIGDVQVKEGAMVFFNSVLRGEETPVVIGKNSAVLDNSFLEGSKIGKNSLISHGASLHLAEIEENVLIGIGAIILDRCEVKSGAIVGAGAVVSPRTKIPQDTLFLGSPARKVREVEDKDRVQIALKELREKSKSYKKAQLRKDRLS